jgi:phage terminase large subunit-like protein
VVTKRKSEQIPTQGTSLFDIEPDPTPDAGSFGMLQDPRLPVSHTFIFGGRAETPGASAKTPSGAIATMESTRSQCPRPLFDSSYENAEEWADEFRRGWAAMATLDRATGEPILPKPQTWLIADAMNAHDLDTGRPLHSTLGVCVPRRAAKTTSILAVAIGRCISRPGYVVIFTAQSGTKASARFLDLARSLDRVNSNDEERGFRILRGAGNQLIEFANGSLFLVVPPKGDAFRGDAGDLIILDESQEHDPVDSEDLLGAILPVMDTRPGAQLVVAGTAGEHRSGLFWDTLEEGRKAVMGTGIVEFAAPEDTPIHMDGEPIEGTVADPEVWRRAHPGIDTLTDTETISIRYAKLGLPQFMREYLGIWPEDFTQSAIPADKWRDGAEPFMDKPAHFALAFDVSPDGSSAAIAAAWRLPSGVAVIEIIRHEPGSSWLVAAAADLAKRHRVVVGHDTIGAAFVEAEALGRERPKPRLRPMMMKDVGAGCAAIMKEIQTGNIIHFDQPGLTNAALNVSKRPLGENAWAWGRKASKVDIGPLIAATHALRVYDSTATATRLGVISAKGMGL